MKKFIAVLMICCIAAALLVGCGVKKKDDVPAEDEKTTSNGDVTEAPDTPEDAGATLDTVLEDILESADQEDIDVAAAPNEDIKVTADLPDGWKEETSSLPFSAQKGSSMVMVSVGWMPDGGSDAMDAAQEAVRQMKSVFEDAEYSTVESKKTAGYDGAGFHIDINLFGSMVQRQVYFYFIKDGKLFMMQGAYMTDDEEAANEVLKVMDSIKIE
jgi:hypothetical protein